MCSYVTMGWAPFGEPSLSFATHLARPPLSPLSNGITGMIIGEAFARRSVLLYIPLETSRTRQFLIFETSPAQPSGRQGGALSERVSELTGRELTRSGSYP